MPAAGRPAAYHPRCPWLAGLHDPVPAGLLLTPYRRHCAPDKAPVCRTRFRVLKIELCSVAKALPQCRLWGVLVTSPARTSTAVLIPLVCCVRARRCTLVAVQPDLTQPVGMAAGFGPDRLARYCCHQGRQLLLYEQHGADDFATRNHLS